MRSVPMAALNVSAFMLRKYRAVAVGDVIRPSTFAGWLYRITEAGSLPASEPDWWDGNTAGPQDLGSARAEVVRYHRPLAHGPVPVETI